MARSAKSKQPLDEHLAIRMAIKEMGLAKIAAHCGVSMACVCRVLKGNRNPSLHTLNALAKTLDCTMADLIAYLRHRAAEQGNTSRAVAIEALEAGQAMGVPAA